MRTVAGEIDAVELYAGPIEPVYRVEFLTTGDPDRDDELRAIVLEVGPLTSRQIANLCRRYRVLAHAYAIDGCPGHRVLFHHPA